MVSLETETDRTLFFDLLPLDVGVIGGMKVRLQLYTVPGQVFYNATRRLVLKGVDGVVFVADSQVAGRASRTRSRSRNLRQNLEELGLDPRSVPHRLPVQQAGPPQHPPRRGAAGGPQPGGAPSFEAAAIHGVGRLRDAEGDLAPLARLDPREDRRGEALGRRRRRRTATPPARRPAALRPRPPPPAPAARRRAAAPPTRPCMEPLAVEFAEEDTDKHEVRPVRTRGSLDIGKELEKLRAITAESKMKAPTAVKDRDVDRLFRDLMTPGRRGRPGDRAEGLPRGPGAPPEGPHRPAHPPRLRPRRPRGDPARRGAGHPGAARAASTASRLQLDLELKGKTLRGQRDPDPRESRSSIFASIVSQEYSRST